MLIWLSDIINGGDNTIVSPTALINRQCFCAKSMSLLPACPLHRLVAVSASTRPLVTSSHRRCFVTACSDAKKAILPTRISDLEAASTRQGARVADLKKAKADKPVIDDAVAELLRRKEVLTGALEEAILVAQAAVVAGSTGAAIEKGDGAHDRVATAYEPDS